MDSLSSLYEKIKSFIIEHKRIIIIAVAVFAVILILNGAFNSKSSSTEDTQTEQSEIVGSWYEADDEYKRDHFVSLAFNKDGTFEGTFAERGLTRIGEPTPFINKTIHGTWSIADKDILQIVCGEENFISYHADYSGDMSDDTWNITNGTLTFRGKTYYRLIQ